jgi:hypothetical protein
MDAVVQEINIQSDSTIPAFRQHATIYIKSQRKLLACGVTTPTLVGHFIEEKLIKLQHRD